MSEVPFMAPEATVDFTVDKKVHGELSSCLQTWAGMCHDMSRMKGFWSEGLSRNKGEMIALIHSELSEWLEAIRNPGQDDHIPSFSNEAVEIADLFIRVMDYIGGFGKTTEVVNAIVAKYEYNATRPPKHGKRF